MQIGKLHLKNLEGVPTVVVADSDLDGTMCRVFTETYLQYKVPILGILQIGSGFGAEALTEIREYLVSRKGEVKALLMADLSPKEDFFPELKLMQKEMGLEFAYIDHHVASFENCPKYLDEKEFYLDDDRCSARILFDHVSDFKRIGKRSGYDAAAITNAYDCWLEDSPWFRHGQEVNFLLWQSMRKLRYSPRMQGAHVTRLYDKFVSDMVTRLHVMDRFEFFDEEKELIVKERESEADLLAKAKKKMQWRNDSKGRRYIYIETPAKRSQLAAALLNAYAGADYIIIRDTYKIKDEPEKTKFSCRARKGNAVALEIATSWGGGGHDEAAGFNLTDFATVTAFLNKEIMIDQGQTGEDDGK